MKKLIALLLTMALVASLFVGCSDNSPNESSDPSGSTGSSPSTGASSDPTATDPSGTDPWADYECITIAKALELCDNYVDAPSEERYYIRATIVSIDNDTYGAMTISDETGTIMVYGSANADGTVRYDAMDSKPVAGDEVLIYGNLQNYKGNTKEIQKGWIIDFISKGGSTEEPEVKLPAADSTLTVGEALALPLKEGQVTEDRYYITATVEAVTNSNYGAMTITDETGSISVYGSYSADGSTGYASMDDRPFKGDTVTLYCTIQNYYGTIEIKNAWIVSFEKAESTYNEADYTDMTIAAARDAATGTKVRVSGVVAQITYANGYIPSGVILVDSTGSIYIYDGQLASQVSIGNTVTVAASKTYWILDSEISNAAKFGYAGCNQLESAYLLSNDKGSTAFDTSWIEETTVKAIMDTPVTENITTKIYKVTALVKRVDGNGFVNYYIDDLDGETGNYVYTQCNGGDFAWLDQYDGKICTVYVMALNAKSTSSGCTWRFLPIDVIDEGFDDSSINVAEHVVKYVGVPQFLSSYTGNPELQLITSADSDLLNFTGAKLSYTSSDPSVISIDNGVMNCHKTGTADITVTGSYNGQTYSEKVTITVTITEVNETYPTVSDAISAAVGETVTVKGIVGPSLVNKTGFYLIDETGVVAVEMDAATLATLEIGYEVVLQGERQINTKGGAGYYGQTTIKNCTVVVNNYGSHEYSTASFDGKLTLAEFYALDVAVDYTTSVFTVTATVEVVETAYYTNIKLVDGDVSVNLYCSSANQYGWLKAYAGQEVTVEIAPCNWNDKSYYVGCVLAVVNADGSKTLNTLNFN